MCVCVCVCVCVGGGMGGARGGSWGEHGEIELKKSVP